MKTSNYLFLVLSSSFDSVGISNCSFYLSVLCLSCLLLPCAIQLLVYRKFKVIASASEAPGIFRNPQCYLLGFSFVPLALSASAFTLLLSNLRANGICFKAVNSFCQSCQSCLPNWHQRI